MSKAKFFEIKPLPRRALVYILITITLAGVMVGGYGYALYKTFSPLGESESRVVLGGFEIIEAVISVASGVAIFLYLVGALARRVVSPVEAEEDVERLSLANLRKQIISEKDAELSEQLKVKEKELVRELEQKYDQALTDSLKADPSDWSSILLSTRRRLLNENGRLASRSRANLLIALYLSVVSISVVTVVVINIVVFRSIEFETLLDIAPVISLVLIVQLLAAYFLRMHYNNEQDIGTNKNELTNVELRMTAIALSVSSEVYLHQIAQKLSLEERNFVIGKKEKSASFDQAEKLASLVQKVKGLAQ